LALSFAFRVGDFIWAHRELRRSRRVNCDVQLLPCQVRVELSHSRALAQLHESVGDFRRQVRPTAAKERLQHRPRLRPFIRSDRAVRVVRRSNIQPDTSPRSWRISWCVDAGTLLCKR
jgi:hypothetical protein